MNQLNDAPLQSEITKANGRETEKRRQKRHKKAEMKQWATKCEEKKNEQK